MKRLTLILSHLFLILGLGASCILEHYAWLKMGMYRYLVLKNTWWLKNFFTPETLPVILVVTIIIMLGVMLKFCRPVTSYAFGYGTLIALLTAYIMRPEYFFTLRAAPWFGLALITSAIFFVISVMIKTRRVI